MTMEPPIYFWSILHNELSGMTEGYHFPSPDLEGDFITEDLEWGNHSEMAVKWLNFLFIFFVVGLWLQWLAGW